MIIKLRICSRLQFSELMKFVSVESERVAVASPAEVSTHAIAFSAARGRSFSGFSRLHARNHAVLVADTRTVFQM